MVCCAAFGCSNHKNKECKGITFHSFPKKAELRQKWVQAVNRRNWAPSASSVLCSAHFRPQDIDRTSLVRVRIRENAVPCIFTGYQSYLQNQKIPKSRKIPGNGECTGVLKIIAIASNVHSEDEMLSDDMESLDAQSSTTQETTTKKTLKRKLDQAVEQNEKCQKNLKTLPQTKRRLTKRQERISTNAGHIHSTDEINVSEETETLAPQSRATQATMSKKASKQKLGQAVEQNENCQKLKTVPQTKRQQRIKTNASHVYSKNEIANKGMETLDSQNSTAQETMTKKALNQKLYQAVEQNEKCQEKLKILPQTKRRLTKRKADLQNIIKELKQKHLISSDVIYVLQQISSSNKEFLSPLGSQSDRYSEELRKFAFTLHFYSPHAYIYVQEIFNTCLPQPQIIRKWYQGINGAPGFTEESFNLLKHKAAADHILCALSVDEMNIQKQIELDDTTYYGYVNMGSGLNNNDDSLPVAKEALTFMLVGINESWKLPVGYFLTNGVSAEQKAHLIKQCLNLCHNAGVKVISVTFDGLSANLGIAVHLGCSFSQPEYKTTFKDPETKEEIAVFIDPPHLIRLIRNAWYAKKIIYDDKGEEIKWSLIENLHKLQEKEGLRLANKLQSGHFYWHKQKMKLKLAARLLSNVVGIAIEECNNLEVPGFESVSATVRFIHVLNGLFEIFDSRNLAQVGLKNPVNPENFETVYAYCKEAEQYLSSLTIICDGFAVKLIDSRLKTGFMGFIVCIRSLFRLYDVYINPSNPKSILKCLPMYKCCQNHLELFFGMIRSYNDCNDNLTARQFIDSYKRILTDNGVKSTEKGDCTTLENISIMGIFSSQNLSIVNQINLTSDRRLPSSESNDNSLPDFQEEHDCFEQNGPFTECTVRIIVYIADFVVRKLENSLKCEMCLDALRGDGGHPAFYFLHKTKPGRLITTANDVVDICVICEKVYRQNYYNRRFKRYKHPIFPLVIDVLSHLRGKKIFEKLNDHIFDQSPLDNHIFLLVKAIVNQYLAIRIKHPHYQIFDMQKKKIVRVLK